MAKTTEIKETTTNLKDKTLSDLTVYLESIDYLLNEYENMSHIFEDDKEEYAKIMEKVSVLRNNKLLVLNELENRLLTL